MAGPQVKFEFGKVGRDQAQGHCAAYQVGIRADPSAGTRAQVQPVARYISFYSCSGVTGQCRVNWLFVASYPLLTTPTCSWFED